MFHQMSESRYLPDVCKAISRYAQFGYLEPYRFGTFSQVDRGSQYLEAGKIRPTLLLTYWLEIHHLEAHMVRKGHRGGRAYAERSRGMG